MAELLDPFVPAPDVRGRHSTLVKAPADLVQQVGRDFDMQSIPAVHAIFWLRTKLMGARAAPARGTGIVASTRSLGWGVLLDEPGRAYADASKP